ncbi:unnamed protein product [Allacma fusca]|uniref:Uncharacterized protein n=1 Tax=Allacma fusca TaxID=39272 RepID=A0A8J2JWV1_9HEXA|nr:unnamed protein product [Allacma fusca]
MSCPFSKVTSSSLGKTPCQQPQTSREHGKGPPLVRTNTLGQSTDSGSLFVSTSDDLNLTSLSSAIIALIVPQGTEAFCGKYP